MTRPLVFLATLFVFTIAAPAAHAFGKKPPAPRPTYPGIQFEASVDTKHAEILASDLRLLESTQVSNSLERAISGLLKLEQVNSATLLQWLRARVRTIVGESYFPADHAYVVHPRVQYPFLDEFLVIERDTGSFGPLDVFRRRSSQIVMHNLGTALYVQGKHSAKLLGLKMSQADDVIVKSPRVGVLQIGPGLFSSSKQVNPDENAAANMVLRVSTLFHEGRHSDGHGSTLGFLHALCPEGHELAGKSACDRNLNGPYMVGALMLQMLSDSCASCTIEEKEKHKLLVADSFSRVIFVTPGVAGAPSVPSVEWDDSPEAIQ